MRTLLSALLLFINGASALGEEIVFEMSVWGVKFGEMVVSRTIENDSTEIFKVEAKGETDFLWMKRKEESFHTIKYVNGILASSKYIYLNKGEMEKWANVTYDDGRYLIESHNGSTTLYEPIINYSLVKFYFEPSFKKAAVFCEEDCSYSELIPMPEKNLIKVHCAEGNKSTYYIEDGKIQEMEIHLAVATVKLTRVR